MSLQSERGGQRASNWEREISDAVSGIPRLAKNSCRGVFRSVFSKWNRTLSRFILSNRWLSVAYSTRREKARQLITQEEIAAARERLSPKTTAILPKGPNLSA